MYTVKSFSKVYKVNVQGGVPFQALLNDVPQCKDLVDASSALAKAGLFLPEPAVDG